MTNERGWKNGVYNPGFTPNKAYLERKAKEFAEAGVEWPEIKGVVFKQPKGHWKPMRNSVTRVVMVGFDPFNNSGLPEHIERRVVHDYWANEELQFVQDWVNDAPEGEIRFGGLINLYGDDTGYKPFPEPLFALDLPDEDELRTKIANTFGLPEHLMKPTLHWPRIDGDVEYRGVKLKDIAVPAELEKTRELVIAIVKEVTDADHPNILTLFVARGGNIRDLSEFFELVKAASPVEDSVTRDLEGIRRNHFGVNPDGEIRREGPVRTREDERAHEQYLRDSVRGIFPHMVLGQTAPDRTGDRDHTKLAIKGTELDIEEINKDAGLVPVFENGEYIPQVKAYAVGADGVKRDLRDLNFMEIVLGANTPEPEPIEGELVDKGVLITVLGEDDGTWQAAKEELPGLQFPGEGGGRLPHIQKFVDIVAESSQQGRNETMAVHYPVTHEEIEDAEQAIQDASEGKLDYLLEDTQWDPKNRKS